MFFGIILSQVIIMAYIEFKNVNKIYNLGEVEIKALNQTNFEIEKGELVVILGQVEQERQHALIS